MGTADLAPVSGIQAWHQSALDQGRFLIQRGAVDGRHLYYPREHSNRSLTKSPRRPRKTKT